ncbi:MAG: phosphoenolpyruvate--protein phosphotransferase [Planctomycetota bacterium]|nr:MAG: phosphoenolpyruvate--protein phosphotransferase [Planctomycetota bacterium]REJ94055.1 MAG: phosphoenolpyruvate--protein phosphotransferase [Planctomycetota bacterium]REK17846.1 MAG: phosphoenolpyruvate--protein phosphotransferase [Planctomycetota bacterium]REK42387.1 MAG: phosphoenolpyruvate--protein phosphotransferase [Planctomycetota bacterium]
MQKLEGIAVSPGVAIAEALVLDQEGFRIPQRFIARDEVESELTRLDAAVDAAGDEIARNRDAITIELGEHYGGIFQAHLRMLRDPRLRGEVEQLVRERRYAPEYAVSRTLRRYAKVFRSLDATFVAQRVSDIFDIEKRLLRHLLGQRREEISKLTSPVIILGHDLTPSETANLDRDFVLGFGTEIGGPGSHTAIVAEGLQIPAVVGIGPFLTDVSGGDVVIIDGDLGWIIIEPDEETLARYRHEAEEHRSLAERLAPLADVAGETVDGTRVQLFGNIEFPVEIDRCTAVGADGVGLYRTEFLYLGAETEPTEDVHYDAYARVVRTMGDRPVCIRTLDLGADKMEHLPRPDDERNPVLGLRSIRLSLRNLSLFRVQLRAVLRASVLGNVKLMFPLISTLMELRQAKMLLAEVMEDLEESGIEFNRDIPVGIMVEVPSVVMLMDRFIEEVDFLSIGTNDLVQYTLAVDRGNKDVANLYTAADPAVLRQIDTVIKASAIGSVPVSLCGQMGANPLYTMLLLGLGLRQFSVPPGMLLELKKAVRSVSIEQCEAVARHAMTLENSRQIKIYLKEELRRLVPELVP